MTFTDREVALEQEMTDRGVERRRAQASRVRAAGRASLTGPGHRLVRAAMLRTVAALEEWTKARKASKTERPLYAAVKAMPARVMALLALRCALDGACAGKSWQAVVHDIARRLDEERAARWLAKEHPGLWASAKRRSKAIPERAASRLRRDVRQLMIDRKFVQWTTGERIKLGALLLALIDQSAGLIRIDRVQTGPRRSVLMLAILPEVADWIAAADRHEEALAPLYMPMVDVPGDWGKGLLGGYSTPLVASKCLVKNRSRATRELVDGADMPAVYGAVNALQRTAWEINPDVLEVARTLWDAGTEAPGLERADADPYPPRPGDGRPTTSWIKARFLIRKGNLYRQSRRVEAARVLWLAKRMAGEGHFFYPQQLDFRGRVYPIPQFLQPQGPDLARGLLRFGQGEWIAATCEAFWVHGANCLGLDKLPLCERVAGIRARMAEVQAVYDDPLENRWWQGADRPWQFLAWCLEAGELVRTGRVLTRVPCYVDGTNNGLQILSLLLRDPAGGAATNCGEGERRDVYQDVADEVTRRLKDADDGTARGWLSWFPNQRMPRAGAKRSVMTLPYGCTPYSVNDYVADWFEDEVRAGRESPWGDAPWGPRAKELSAHLWAAIEARLGKALEAMRWFKDVSRVSMDAGVGPVWAAPSGFPVRQSYTNWEVSQVRTKFGERVRWVRTRRAGERLNRRRHVNALAPNFVHSVDAAILCRVVARFSPDGSTPVSTIHDSFGSTAGRMDALGRAIREEYAAVFAGDLLEDFRQQLVANAGGRVSFPEPPSRGTLDPAAVLGSQYLFS